MLQLLENIYQGKNLDLEQSLSSFTELLKGQVEQPLVAAMLIALKTKGESVEEIAGAAKALREQAKPFPKTHYSMTDCCGTGGDGLNTINVSTLSALVSASMGVKIVKHGNRSVSSHCGSSDLMSALGINTQLTPEKSKDLLDKTNFCFLFAPDYHQGVKHVMPVRQSLKTRTIFNLIGPLANPALPDIQLLGVYDKKYCESFAKILNILGTRKALIVNGSGLDEIATHDITHATYLEDGEINNIIMTPESLGIKKHSLSDIQLSNIEDNIALGIDVLKGKAKESLIDMVAVNTGAVLYLNEISEQLSDCVQLAKEHITSGKTFEHMQLIRELSND